MCPSLSCNVFQGCTMQLVKAECWNRCGHKVYFHIKSYEKKFYFKFIFETNLRKGLECIISNFCVLGFHLFQSNYARLLIIKFFEYLLGFITWEIQIGLFCSPFSDHYNGNSNEKKHLRWKYLWSCTLFWHVFSDVCCVFPLI